MVTIRSRRDGRRAGLRAASVLALALGAVPAASNADTDPGAGGTGSERSNGEVMDPSASGAPTWSAGLYAEGDSEGGIGGVADLVWFVGGHSQLYLGANYADTTRNLSGLSTHGYTFGGAHDFGTMGVDAWYDAWTDPDVVAARSVNGAVDVEMGDWTVALTGQLRRSDFETFAADAEVTLRTGQRVTVTAAADCELDNTGFGMRVGFVDGRWRGHVRGMSFSYSGTECRFSSPVLDYLRRTRPAVFQQFAQQVTTPLSMSATTWIGAENALLDRSWGGGLAYDAGRLEYAIDYLGLEEHFDGLRSDSLSGSLVIEAGRSLEVLVTAGYSDGEALDPAWLGGLGLRARF